MTQAFLHLNEQDPERIERAKLVSQEVERLLRAIGQWPRVERGQIMFAMVYDEPDHPAIVERLCAKYAPDIARFQYALTALPEIGDITIVLMTPRPGRSTQAILERQCEVSIPGPRFH